MSKSLSDLIAKVREINKTFPNQWDGKTRFIDLNEEIGELANAILLEEGEKPEGRRRSYLEDSFADVFYDLILLANTYDVDLEKVTYTMLGELEERIKSGEFEFKTKSLKSEK